MASPTTTPSAASPDPPRPRAWWPAALAGLLAMLALIGLQETLNGLNQAIVSAPSAAAQTIIRLTPGAVTTFMIETLGKDAIRLLVASAYAGTALVGLALGLIAARLRGAGRAGRALAVLAGVPFLLYLLVAPAQARDAASLALAAVAGAALSAAYAGLTLALWRGVQPAAFQAGGAAAAPQRRALLGGGLAAVALLAAGGTALGQALRGQAATPAALTPLEPLATPTAAPAAPTSLPAAAAPTTTPVPAATATPPATTAAPTAAPPTPAAPTATPGPSPEQQEDEYFARIAGLVPEVTPIGKFYVVDEAVDDPRVDVRSWKLTVRGHVERPVTLTFDELRALPAVDQYATLMCISYELGQDLISNAKWRGVRLSEVLKLAGIKPGATEVVLRSVDEYDESHSFEKAMEPTTILAYGMNDVLLPRQHGAPLRALVPGLYGYKNVKWLAEIEVISGKPHAGYWERSAGWDQVGRLASAMSRIDTVDSPPVKAGGRAIVGGIAFAGPRGISRVEVSDDGGKSWGPARLKRALSPLTWRLWAFEWKPARAGKAKLLVRAYEGDGTPQVAEERPAHPSGATGLHGFDYDVAP
jgi:DMSO/TMAO reductase YedYZ molybdopterin-dependent catalytic subunit